MTNNRLFDFWIKYRVAILAVILAIYSLPPAFYCAPGGETDGSWIRAMNIAIKDHLVFGRDIVFTYGPLSFLSTRNGQYINGVFLLLGDAFLFLGFYYIIRKYLQQYKGWFFLLLLSVLCIRGSNYAQELFLLFVVFSILNFKSQFRNYWELTYCTVAGILIFFIKVNYGLVSLFILLAIACYLLITNRRSFAVLAVTAALFSSLIYGNVHIDLLNYIRYSLPLIQYYDESMMVEIQPKSTGFVSALALIAIFCLTMCYNLWGLFKQRKNLMEAVISLVLLSLTCFLFYKNGFTRFDFFHYNEFYFVFPLFIIFTLFISDFGKSVVSRIVALAVVAVSIVNMQEYPFTLTSSANYVRYATYTSVINYCSGIFKPQEEFITVNIPPGELHKIGNATVDIMPKQIALLQLNHLNYAPRPVIQTYSAYAPTLDSLNAAHFCKANRPDFVMIKDGSIDTRYFPWDESITRATLHLNYSCNDSISFLDSMDHNKPYSFLLLRSKKKSSVFPKFEKISEMVINFDEMVPISFPDSVPVYMTAEMVYTASGLVKKLFYQPPLITVTLQPGGRDPISYRAVRPIINHPVLINKFINDNTGLRNFFTGNIKENANIKGFMFHASRSELKQQIKITFLRFVNY